MPATAHSFSHFQPATALYHPHNAMALAHVSRLAYNAAHGIPKVAATWVFRAAVSGWWSAFVNRMRGRIDDLGSLRPADLKQHSIDTYVADAKNRAIHPF